MTTDSLNTGCDFFRIYAFAANQQLPVLDFCYMDQGVWLSYFNFEDALTVSRPKLMQVMLM